MTALDSQGSELVEPFTPDDRGDQVKGQGPKRLEMRHKRKGAALCCEAQHLFEAQGQGRSLVQQHNAVEVRAVERLGDHPHVSLVQAGLFIFNQFFFSASYSFAQELYCSKSFGKLTQSHKSCSR